MFDIGVNLTSSRFAKDRDDVMARAQEAGVSGMLLTGTNLHESLQAQQLAKHYPRCWSTAGVHPHDSSSWTQETANTLRQLAEQPEVVAIGECGLDFNRNFSTPEEQERAFSAQLALAAELAMPVFLHCRDAHERFLTLLDPWLPRLPARCCTVLPARYTKRRRVWHGVFIWVLPAGYVMNAVDWNCATCCHISPLTVCLLKPMRRIYCHGICRRNRHQGATNPRIWGIFWPVSLSCAVKMPNG